MAAGALAALRWLVASGADESVDNQARDRFAAAAAPAEARFGEARDAPDERETAVGGRAGGGAVRFAPTAALIAEARAAALAADTVSALAGAVAAFDGCALKRTARNTVFADGNPLADLMLVGEAPGAEEDRRGLPFVGAAGRLLDRMLLAIGRDRDSAYITNLLFWRPPGNRNPSVEEIALCRPFVERHIALVRPRVLVCVGGISAKTLLDRSEGITRLRGRWFETRIDGLEAAIPAIAIYHPAFLLRQPSQKARAWRDLLILRDRLAAA